MALWLSGPFGALFLALSPPDPVTPACLDLPCFISLDAGLRPRSPVLKAFFPLVWNSAPLIFLTLLLAWPLRVLLLDYSLHIGNSFGFLHKFWLIVPTFIEFSHPFLPILVAAAAFMMTTFNAGYPAHISGWRAMCMYTTTCSKFH